MKTLKDKVKKSLAIIEKTKKKFAKEKIAVAWTGGKDSTVMLHLVRKVCGDVPFPVFFNDSTMEFPEVYEFIERMKDEWNLDLITIKHSKAKLNKFHKAGVEEKKKMSRDMKVDSIKRALKKYKFEVFMAAIRWDEHGSRSKEKFFSPRSDHMRVHPVLHFTESDIWDYIRQEKVPYVKLYDEGYRSLGEMPFTGKAKKGGGERSGRDYDKEKIMEKLRALGYW